MTAPGERLPFETASEQLPISQAYFERITQELAQEAEREKLGLPEEPEEAEEAEEPEESFEDAAVREFEGAEEPEESFEDAAVREFEGDPLKLSRVFARLSDGNKRRAVEVQTEAHRIEVKAEAKEIVAAKALRRAGDLWDGWRTADGAAALDDDQEPLKPSLLRRSDGLCLLYRGETHSLAGESGSGKSWLAQHAVAEVLRGGGSAVYIDYESNPRSVYRRLQLLGCTREDLLDRCFEYVRPEGPPAGRGFEHLLRGRYDLVVIDGVTRALTLSGLAGDNLSNDNEAVTKWNAMFPERVARETGAAVLMVDHVTKSKDGRGGYAIGAQSKRATITGAAYIVSRVEGFGRGRSGSFDVFVSKDREGFVEGEAGGEGGHVCRVHVDSSEDGAVRLDLRTVTRPTEDEAREGYRVRVSAFLAELPEGGEASINTVRQKVEGKTDAVLDALRDLVNLGYVERRAKGQAQMHRSVKPYVPMFEEVEDD